MLKPVIALVGRPNVGKSTLFNRLIGGRQALVAASPGSTRDRHYGDTLIGDHRVSIVDTSGIALSGDEKLNDVTGAAFRQTQVAVAEASIILFIIDYRSGLVTIDYEIAKLVRQQNCPVLMVVNKAEGVGDPSYFAAECYALGLGSPVFISAGHGDGLTLFRQQLRDLMNRHHGLTSLVASDVATDGGVPNLVVLGRPNVGKSSFVNALLGQDRLVTSSTPGTTRDAISVPFTYGDKKYCLIDTAGIRKASCMLEKIDFYSVTRSRELVEQANVVLLMVDVSQGIVDQDAAIAQYVIDQGKPLLVLMNKIDLLSDEYQKKQFHLSLKRRLHFIYYTCHLEISVKNRWGFRDIFNYVDKSYSSAYYSFPTSQLTRVIRSAVSEHPPPYCGKVRPKIRYAHQGGAHPPTIVLHGNSLDLISASYFRYLERYLRSNFSLQGTPLRISCKKVVNPYVDA